MLRTYEELFEQQDDEAREYILQALFDRQLIFKTPWIWRYIEENRQSLLFAFWVYLVTERWDELETQAKSSGREAQSRIADYLQVLGHITFEHKVRLLQIVNYYQKDELALWYVDHLRELALTLGPKERAWSASLADDLFRPGLHSIKSFKRVREACHRYLNINRVAERIGAIAGEQPEATADKIMQAFEERCQKDATLNETTRAIKKAVEEVPEPERETTLTERFTKAAEVVKGKFAELWNDPTGNYKNRWTIVQYFLLLVLAVDVGLAAHDALSAAVVVGPGALSTAPSSEIRHPQVSDRLSDSTDGVIPTLGGDGSINAFHSVSLGANRATVLKVSKETLSRFEVYRRTWKQLLTGTGERVVILGAGTGEREVIYALEGEDLSRYLSSFTRL